MIDEKRLIELEYCYPSIPTTLLGGKRFYELKIVSDARDLVAEVRRLHKLIGKPLRHPVTNVAEWRWMANHIASMRPPYSDLIQNSSFIVVQKAVCEILRRFDTFQGDIE